MPVTALPYIADPIPALQYLDARFPDAVLLDSGPETPWRGRYDILSAGARIDAHLRFGLPASRQEGVSPNEQIQARQMAHISQLSELSSDSSTYTRLPFTGGLMVSLAYPGTCASADDILVAGGWYDQAIVTDHHLDLSWLVSGRESHQGTLSALLSAARATDLSKPEFELASAFSPMVDEAEYRMQVNQILEHIYAGDCYQVNFAQPFSATFRGHAAAAYQRLRRAAGGPWSGFMRYQGGCILSCSPESLLEVNQQQVCSSPIKGTVRRAVDTREDQLLKASLAGSHKDKAENLMIVDLIRNDLGKVAEPGSINVTELFGLYSFANVHHLVSRIEARLKAQASAVDALTALWPGGSVTGAPKAMSMGIIDRLEAIPRGFYCGSMGYISNNGRAAFNIMIRTMTTQQQSISCWGGGGIVADSCPRKEYQESLTKIDRLIQALSCN